MSLARFGKDWGDGQGIGFGNRSYSDAIAAGYSAGQINNFINSGAVRSGQRAQDMAAAGAAAEANAAASAQRGFQEQLASQRRQYEMQFAGYQTQISGLQNQYNSALGKASEFETQARDWEDQFTQKSAEYESARDEAQRYRDEAVGQQLRAMKSGATAGGSNSTAQQGGLASGKTQYQVEDDSGIQIDKEVKAESGALSGKGSVVQRINSRSNRPSSQPARPNQGLASGSTQGYYASRFG